jgi:hypothetical protein
MLQKSFRFFAAALLCCAAGPARGQEGPWQLVAPMGLGGNSLGAATGPDGRIYAIGGTFSYSLGGVVQAYDPRTNTWTGAANMSQARQAPGCVTGPDGRIYAIGGSWSWSAEAYDTRANRWSRIAPLPLSAWVVHSAAVGNDGRIYALVLPAGDAGFPPYLVAYDIATNTWSPRLDPPVTLPGASPRVVPALASDAAGRIYVAGGVDVFIFDPQAHSWRAARPMTTARSWFALAPGGDGRLYAIGGDAAGTVEAYDPAQDSWAAVSPLHVPRLTHAATMGPDGRVYALGGQHAAGDYGYYLNAVEVYQPGQPSSGPSVTAASIRAVEGAPFTGVVASFTDSRATTAADFAASIQWGDGQTSSGLISANGSGGFAVTGSHLYPLAGSYITKVTVRATAGGSGTSSGAAEVADAPLTARGLNLASSSKSFSGQVATFTDANPYSAASEFTAVIRWGDGSSSAGTIQAIPAGGFSVSGAHSYRKVGTYTVLVSLRGVGGSTATAGTTLTVTSGKR